MIPVYVLYFDKYTLVVGTVQISGLHEFRANGVTSRKAGLWWELPEYILMGTFFIDFVIDYSSAWDSTPRQVSLQNTIN